MKKFLKKKLYVFICQQPFSKVFSPSSINDSSKTFIATIFVTFKSLYPFKVNNMYISNLNNYLLFKNKSNKSFIFIIFIYSASASFPSPRYETLIACEKLFCVYNILMTGSLYLLHLMKLMS